MRISISNIAWDVRDDEAVAELLSRHEVDAIDVAPGKYFPDPKAASDADIARVRAAWAARGVDVVGMQALLFGTSGLNLFGNATVQAAMLAHLEAVCRIGAGLGATRLVFGSPKNRDRGELDDEACVQIATDFFRRLGDIAIAHGVFICLEPTPPLYGANFMTTSAETAAVVLRVAHPAIRMQLDTGACILTGESPEAVVRECAPLVGHVHAIEPGLVPLGTKQTPHGVFAALLEQALPGHVVTVEMLASDPPLVAIDSALTVATLHYRDSSIRTDS